MTSKSKAVRCSAAILLLLLAATRTAAAQTSIVVMPRGAVPDDQARQAAQMDFVPTDRALRWLPGDTLLVAHFEAYGSGFAFFVNCQGSGFFKVPIGGGSPVRLGQPFCAMQGSLSATPDGRSVLFFGEPAYERRGTGIFRTRDAAMLRLTLASSAIDTVRASCGSGSKDAALSSTGRLAWTGPCRDSADIARDKACKGAPGSRAPGCSAEERIGIFVSPLAGGAARRAGGPTDLDAHEPSWSPDGASIAFNVGENPLPGRWEVTESVPGTLMIADNKGARALGVTGEAPSWSPDGRTLAYYGDDTDDSNERYGGPRVYLVSPDGTNARRVFMNDDVATYSEYMGPVPMTVRDGKAFGPLVWSPDGKWLVFSRQYRDGASVWRLDVSTGRIERLTSIG